MSDPAATLIERCQYQADIKKSRFSAEAAPTASADEALAFVHAINGTEATHHCWANRIGADYCFNDDGDPGGTAGRPILPAIEGQGMDRVVVVVTRWYDCIRLGAGGLMRA